MIETLKNDSVKCVFPQVFSMFQEQSAFLYSAFCYNGGDLEVATT